MSRRAANGPPIGHPLINVVPESVFTLGCLTAPGLYGVDILFDQSRTQCIRATARTILDEELEVATRLHRAPIVTIRCVFCSGALSIARLTCLRRREMDSTASAERLLGTDSRPVK